MQIFEFLSRRKLLFTNGKSMYIVYIKVQYWANMAIIENISDVWICVVLALNWKYLDHAMQIVEFISNSK